MSACWFPECVTRISIKRGWSLLVVRSGNLRGGGWDVVRIGPSLIVPEYRPTLRESMQLFRQCV